MDKRDLIIPARFDSRGAAAGLKAVGGGGHASGDLGQAAAVAADQFRRAHESVESALQEFNLLRRASGGEGRPAGGDPAADEAAQGAGAKFPAEDWLESREGLRGAAGARLGGSGSGPMEGKTGGPPPLSTRRPLSQVEADRPDASPGRSYGPIQAETDPTAAGGPAAPGSARAEGSSAPESSNSFVLGLSGAPSGRVGPSEAIPLDNRPGLARRDGATRQAMAGDLQEGEILADLRRRQGSAEGADDSGTEPVGSGRAGRTGQDGIADYAEWIAGGGDGGRDRFVAARGVGTAAVDGSAGVRQRERPDARDEAEAWQISGMIAEGSDPREGIRRARASSPVAAPADVSIADGRTTRPGRGTAGFSAGQTDPESRSGVMSNGTIERLLREQNELIRQDLQRNANPSIAAPPPMRGGGIRM